MCVATESASFVKVVMRMITAKSYQELEILGQHLASALFYIRNTFIRNLRLKLGKD